MCDMSPALPDCSVAATESPPPMIVVAPLSLVRSARMSTIPKVPFSKAFISKTPMGVHNDGLAVREKFLLLCSGVRTIVKTHPAIRDGISRNNLGLSLRIKLICNNNIRGKEYLLAK